MEIVKWPTADVRRAALLAVARVLTPALLGGLVALGLVPEACAAPLRELLLKLFGL